MGTLSSSAPPRPAAVVTVLAYCTALAVVSTNTVLPLLPDFPRLLDTSYSNVSWLMTAPLVSGAVSVPVLGRIGDMYGKRRMMQWGLALMLAGSIACALANDIWTLVAGRTVQGMSLAVLSITLAIAKDLLPPERVNHGLAVVSASLGIGNGVAIPLSGVLYDIAGWRSVFWATAVLAAVAMVLTHRVLPTTDHREPGRFDIVGATVLSAVLVAFLLPLSKSPTWGFLAPLPLTLYALAIVGAVAWVAYERHPEVPLVNLALMRTRPLMLANLSAVMMGFCLFTNSFGALSLLQASPEVSGGAGLSVLAAGAVLTAPALAPMLTSPFSARMTNRFGGRTTLWVGSAAIAVAFFVRPLLTDSALLIVLGAVLGSAGIGFTYGAMPAVVMSYVPPGEISSANSVGTLARSVGSAAGSATFAAMFGAITATLAGREVPRLAAFQVMFLIAGLASLLATLMALALPRRQPT